MAKLARHVNGGGIRERQARVLIEHEQGLLRLMSGKTGLLRAAGHEDGGVRIHRAGAGSHEESAPRLGTRHRRKNHRLLCCAVD